MQELTFSGLMEGVLVLQAPEDLEQDPEQLELQPGQGLHHPSKPRSRFFFTLKATNLFVIWSGTFIACDKLRTNRKTTSLDRTI